MKTIVLILLCSSFLISLKDTIKPKKSTDSIKTIIVSKDTTTMNVKHSVNLDFSNSKSDHLKVVYINNDNKDFLETLIPIITFLLGFFLPLIVSWIKRKSDLVKIGNRWIAEISFLDSPIKKQIESLEKFSIERIENEFDFPKIKQNVNLSGEIFKSLDKGELLQYIEKHKKLKFEETVIISNRTHGFISILMHLFDYLKEIYFDYKNNFSTIYSSFNENIRRLSQSIGKYSVQLENEANQDNAKNQLVSSMFGLMEKHIYSVKNNTVNVFKLENDLFEPLMVITAQLRHDDRTSDIITYLSECTLAITKLRLENKYFIENINSIIGQYREQLKDLQQIVDDLK